LLDLLLDLEDGAIFVPNFGMLVSFHRVTQLYVTKDIMFCSHACVNLRFCRTLLLTLKAVKSKVKISLFQAVEAHRVARG
jgi:hypothetical protein